MKHDDIVSARPRIARILDAPQARDRATRLFEMSIVKNDVLRECYNAETGAGLGQTKFWGFTVHYYGLFLECELKFDASSLNQPFRPIIPDELGISFKSTS